MREPGLLGEAERMTCYTREVTAGMTAQTALRELDELNVPESMSPLVAETQVALEDVADTDLESECGPPMSEIKESRRCDRALGSRMGAYQRLESVLDRWSPYL